MTKIAEIEGTSISAEDVKRIQDAIAELAKDPHAPRSLSVTVRLHIHNEYPKHVKVGEREDEFKNKVAVTKIANNEAEEKAILAAQE